MNVGSVGQNSIKRKQSNKRGKTFTRCGSLQTVAIVICPYAISEDRWINFDFYDDL